MDNDDLKNYVKTTFNTVAGGYDSSAMRFFPESAKEIYLCLNLEGHEQVLDVATGTGGAALAIAENLPDGKVTGIDFSEGMLAQAKKKKEERGLTNVSFIEMDMQNIDLPDKSYDVAVSSFGIFFVEDMETQLSHIGDKVKDGGKVIATSFYDNSFSPFTDLLFDRLAKYGIEPPTMSWKRIATTEQCVELFENSGLNNIASEQKSCGYYLKDSSDWWYIVWNGGFRGMVSQLSEEDFKQFKKDHMEEIEKLATNDGIWLEMSVIYTIGRK